MVEIRAWWSLVFTLAQAKYKMRVVGGGVMFDAAGPREEYAELCGIREASHVLRIGTAVGQRSERSQVLKCQTKKSHIVLRPSTTHTTCVQRVT